MFVINYSVQSLDDLTGCLLFSFSCILSICPVCNQLSPIYLFILLLGFCFWFYSYTVKRWYYFDGIFKISSDILFVT